jgi:hypothetical protein
MQPGLTIRDCKKVFDAAGTDLVLIGGQAVSLWAAEFESELNLGEQQTSKDIDYWGDRQLLVRLAKKLNTVPKFPDMHSFTVLSGIVQTWAGDKQLKVDVLHSVPGVPDADWERITLIVQSEVGEVRALDPISLIGSKLHNLKNFDQTNRRDLPQLLICIKIARPFLVKAFRRDVRRALTYLKCFLDIACMANNQRVIKEHNIPIFDAVPIETIESLAADASIAEDARLRLNKFLTIRWAQLKADGLVA